MGLSCAGWKINRLATFKSVWDRFNMLTTKRVFSTCFFGSTRKNKRGKTVLENVFVAFDRDFGRTDFSHVQNKLVAGIMKCYGWGSNQMGVSRARVLQNGIADRSGCSPIPVYDGVRTGGINMHNITRDLRTLVSAPPPHYVMWNAVHVHSAHSRFWNDIRFEYDNFVWIRWFRFFLSQNPGVPLPISCHTILINAWSSSYYNIKHPASRPPRNRFPPSLFSFQSPHSLFSKKYKILETGSL